MTVRRNLIGAAMILLLGLPCAIAAQGDAGLSEIAAALSNRQFAKAEQLASVALAAKNLSDVDHSRLLLDRGLAREQQADYSGALPDLTQAVESHALPKTEQALALFDRGIALDALGRLQDALKDYDASVKLSPGSAAALNNRANAYRRLGRLEDARRDYLASLAAGNSQPEYPNYGLGQIAEAQGDTNMARDYYAKALAAAPGYRLAAERLAALGGAHKGSAADTTAIVLHPPGRPLQAEVASAKPLPAVPPLPDNSVPLSATQLALHLRTASARHRDNSLPLRPAIVSGKVSAHSHQVQLGSWRQEAQANAAWTRALKKAGGDLAGLSPQIVPADLPGRGRYYRLRVSPEATAGKFCADLTAKGLDCLPVSD